MDFGVFDHLDRGSMPLDAYYESRLRVIEMYDRGGFYGYHVAEHHATPLGMAASPSVFLAAVAQRTKTLRLAEEICMLDQMSGGRLELGFGRGASPLEIDIFGPDPADAQDIYSESLEIILTALRDQHVDFQRKFFTLNDVPIALEPKQSPHPPMWYGIHAVESAARAGTNGFNVISLDTASDTGPMVAAYKAARQEAKLDGPEPKIGIGRFIVVGDTDENALAVARRAYPIWHESFNYLFNYRGAAAPRHQRPSKFDDMAALGRAVAGSPETVIGVLRNEMNASDANYLVGQFVFGDMSSEEAETSIGLFIDKVIPNLKA